MSGHQKKGASRVLLMFAVFFLPGLLLLIMSNSSSTYSYPKFYYESTDKISSNGTTSKDSSKVQFESFQFKDDQGSIITQEDYKDQYILIGAVANSCPRVCASAISQFKYLVYNEMLKSRNGYEDVKIITEIVQYSSSKDTDITSVVEQMEVDSSIWKFALSDRNPFFNFKQRGQNLLDLKVKGAISNQAYHSVFLLLDKNHCLRGIYQGDKSSQINILFQDLKMLKKEELYQKNKDAQK